MLSKVEGLGVKTVTGTMDVSDEDMVSISVT